MKKLTLLAITVLSASLVSAGWAYAVSEHHGEGPGNEEMEHHRMWGHSKMESSLFATPGSTIKVTPTKSGAMIEITASDPTAIARIQKKAQIMQLMHELHELSPEHPQESQKEGQESPQQEGGS